MSADVSVPDRKATVDAFQQDPDSDSDLEADILVLPTKVYGKGFTMTRARRIIIMDLDWLEETHLQGIKRVHRIGSLIKNDFEIDLQKKNDHRRSNSMS